LEGSGEVVGGSKFVVTVTISALSVAGLTGVKVVRVVITTDDVVIGWVDVGDISLLDNRLEFHPKGTTEMISKLSRM
jgi:hypothetical protein